MYSLSDTLAFHNYIQLCHIAARTSHKLVINAYNINFLHLYERKTSQIKNLTQFLYSRSAVSQYENEAYGNDS